MRIGIDFDNTIVCYDEVFLSLGQELSLPKEIPRFKGKIRDYFRAIGKEETWTELQGMIYGKLMPLARPFPGIEEFFFHFQGESFIISHKTLHPYKGPPYDLHKVAKEWIQKHPFLDNTPAFFELTLTKKLARIRDLHCDLFIDDLPEVLMESSFPENVKKVLFDPSHAFPEDSHYQKASSWQEIKALCSPF